MEKFESIWRYPTVALWAIAILAIILLVGVTRVAQLMEVTRPVPGKNWSGSEVIQRPRLSCFVYLIIALACGGTVWDLRHAYQAPMVLPGLVALVSAAAYMLIKAWTDCRGPLLTLNERGIVCAKYGLIPWVEVERVKLEVVPLRGGEFSNLMLYVSNPEKYRARLSRFQSLYERVLAKKVVKFKDVIVVSLDGFYRKPSDIFSVVEHLHQQARRSFGKDIRVEKTETDNTSRWKQVVSVVTQVVGTAALLIVMWWLAKAHIFG